MASRRGKGEGSIRWREDKQLWEGRYNAGVNPKTGQIRQKSIYGKRKKDVLRRMRDTLQELDKGQYVEPSKMSLYNWCAQWLEVYKLPTLIRVNTQKRYKVSLKRLSRYDIAGVPIKDITSDMLQRTYNDMHKIYKSGTIAATSTLINAALAEAVRLRRLPKNPATDAHVPQDAVDKRVKALNEEQLKRFLLGLKREELYYTPALFMVNTGVRIGEALGLNRADLDLTKRTVRIHSTYLPDERILQPETKTKSSTRVVPLPSFIIAPLREYLLRQPDKSDQAPLFQNSIGNRISYRNFSRRIKAVGAAINCNWVSLHTLRHTYASRLFAQGVDVKIVSALLGHGSVTITYDLYIHFIDSAPVDAVQLLNALAPTEPPKKDNVKIMGT